MPKLQHPETQLLYEETIEDGLKVVTAALHAAADALYMNLHMYDQDDHKEKFNYLGPETIAYLIQTIEFIREHIQRLSDYLVNYINAGVRYKQILEKHKDKIFNLSFVFLDTTNLLDSIKELKEYEADKLEGYSKNLFDFMVNTVITYPEYLRELSKNIESTFNDTMLELDEDCMLFESLPDEDCRLQEFKFEGLPQEYAEAT
jgi:hypothetical protein